MSDSNHDDDTAFLSWQRQAAGGKTIGGLALVAAIVTTVGWLLLFHKVAQTSDFALQFSDEVHEQLGEWILCLGALTLITAGLVVGAAIVRTRIKVARDALVNSLRGRLADASDSGTRSKIESQLRELGA